MTGDSRLSRLNPAYLAVRNGGAFFLCLALGITGGLLYQTLATPRGLVARGTRALVVMPPESAADYDWEAAALRLSAFLRDPGRRQLLTANLRFTLKHSPGGPPADGDDRPPLLRERLLEYGKALIMDTSPWDRPFPPYFGPEMRLTLSDLAANIDYQSLASVLSDVDPPPGKGGWDFSFFKPAGNRPASANMVTRAEPDDRFFAVFYRVHELRENRTAFSPDEAWRSAVAELNGRLLRESEFRGGGGFGERATRELLRELDAVPALAANGLYGAAGRLHSAHDPAPWERDLWLGRWDAARMHFDKSDAAHALLTLELPNTLLPLRFPADSPLTRIDALAVETALSYLGAFLERSAKRMPLPAAPTGGGEAEKRESEPPPAEKPPAPRPPRPPQPPRRAAPAEDPLRLAALERAVLDARKARDNCALLREAARDEAELAAREASAARERADRFKERLDALEFDEIGLSREWLESPETLELEKLREGVLRRLAELRLDCSEEHPFVRAALRELAALERRLLEADDGSVEAALEERRIRIRNLALEWQSSDAAAGTLADRLNHAAEAANRLLADLAAAEARLAEAEHALAAHRGTLPSRIEYLELAAENIGRVADAVAESRRPDETVPAPSAPEPQKPAPAPPTAAANLFCPPGPVDISVAAIPLSRRPLEIGAGLGLCLGLLWMAAHEVFGSRLTNSFEARRWVNVPVLASIPRYDAGSLSLGAKSLGAKLEAYGGRRTLMPPSVDMAEPAPLGKRRTLAFHRASRRWRALAVGVAILLLAAGLRQIVVGDAWRIPPGERPPMLREGRR